MPQADVCIIFNPHAGRGRARQALDRLRRILGPRADFRPTTSLGHAEELAMVAAQEGFAYVAAAGGDGTVHEVVNGLMRAAQPNVTFAVVPLGSANDYAHALGLASDWWERPNNGVGVRQVDVAQVESGTRRRWFCNCFGLGFNGHVTREARKIKGLRGIPLYVLALVRTVSSRFATPPLEVCIDDKLELRGPALAFSLALGPREGNFVVAPDAVLDDGKMEYVWGGALTRWSLLGFVPGLVTGSPPVHTELRRGCCQRVRVQAEQPLIVHLDGEFFCVPEEGITQLQVQLLPAVLRVLGCPVFTTEHRRD